MDDLIIHNPLAEQLRSIAQREHRQVEEVLADLLKQYESQALSDTTQSKADALTAMAGMFDDDVTDLSTAVNETMDAYYHKKIRQS
jgi:hypothetical protein